MSLISELFSPKEYRNAATFGAAVESARSPSAGASVTVDKALRVATVFDCLRVIGEGVAQVPLKIYLSGQDGSKEVAYDNPWHEILSIRPNEWQTSFEFRENLIYQAGLTGNFYAFKNMVRGKPVSLIPFEPGTVSLEVDSKRKILYSVNMDGGQKVFPASAIWHVKGPSWQTHVGMESVKYARDAIGLAIDIEDSQSKLHANGSRTTGMYSVERDLKPDQYITLRDWVHNNLSGANKFKPLILDRSAKYQSISMTGVDAQTIENRRFQIEEICRVFRVMPIMIGQADKAATYASSEQMFLAHVIHTLMPWYTRIEQSIDANLLTPEERKKGFYSKFNANGLMRGAAKDRAEYYTKMASIGALSPNDIRSLEDMNPYEGGDKYFFPLNFSSTDEADQNKEQDDKQIP